MVYGFTINIDGNATAQMAKINEALSGFGVKAKEETSKAETAFTKMGDSIKGVFSNIKGLLLGGIGIGAAFEGIQMIKDATQFYNENEAALTKVNAALASTKGIAGETAQHLNDVATAMDGKVIFGKPQIEDAQSMLLTFTQIRGEIFDKTMPAITDFATRFKMELPEAAMMLGKALNDPLKGMTRLQRQGVVFSESQRETIKNFMKTGQVAKAQQVILGELKTEFGGLASAMTQTSEGKLEMAKKQWDEIKLKVGEIVMKVQLALIPIIGFLAKGIQGLIGFFTSSSESATIFRDILLSVGAALVLYYGYLAVVASWTAIVTAATWAWDAAMAANPLTWIILGIIALITVLAVLWDKFKGFREFLGGFFGFLQESVKLLINWFIDLGRVVYDVFTGHFIQAFEDGKKAFSDFKEHVTKGMSEAITKGATAAGNSTFKFGDLLKFNSNAGLTASQQTTAAGKAATSSSAVKNHALKTSELSGAKGGLGEAKVVNIHIDKVMNIEKVGAEELHKYGHDAADELIKTVNNIAYESSSTQ